MTEQHWKPLFRVPASTVTRVLRSPAFLHARERAAGLIESPSELRALADRVEGLDHQSPPLSAVADRVFAAVRFLRWTADRLDDESATGAPPAHAAAGAAARERLLVAGLLYLVTPDDLVPDFRPGGYIDDVFLLAWVFGAAVSELEPHLVEAEHPADDTAGPAAPSWPDEEPT